MAKRSKRKNKNIVARRRRDDFDEASNAGPVKWWLAELGQDAQAKLWTWIERHRTQWSFDGVGDLVHEAIYADRPLAAGATFDGTRWLGTTSGPRSPMNVLKSLVDTGTARMTKNRAMPCITAEDATYSEKRFARKASRVLRRKMGSGDIEKMSPLVIRDFLIRGTAVGKVEREGGDTCTKRVPIFEVVYDHREVQFGPPRSLAHVRPEPRDVMLARFPKSTDAIANVQPFTRQDPWMMYVYQGPSTADLIEVAESWHPPSGPDADDGQHIIAIRGTTVLREPWRRPRYPIAFVHWTAPTRGIRGEGIIAEFSAGQDMVNEILIDARDGLRHGSQLKVFVQRSANVNKHHLRARHPALVEFDGNEPRYVAPNPVSEQAWRMAFQIKDEMYALSGISQWAASSKNPLGANAPARALDTMNDNQSDRFAHVESGYQQWRCELGQLHIDEACAMHDEAAGNVEQVFDEQPEPIATDELAAWIRDTEWPKVDIDGGDYHLTLEPINFVSGTRGGKLTEAAELAKAGLVPDPTMTAALFDEPDIIRMNRPVLGPYHRIERCLEGLADPKVPYLDVAPDFYTNFALAELMAKGELEEIKADARPDNEEDQLIIERFMQYLGDVDRLKKQAANQNTGAPSLAGAQSNTTVAQGNAATLQGGGAPPPAAPPMGVAA